MLDQLSSLALLCGAWVATARDGAVTPAVSHWHASLCQRRMRLLSLVLGACIQAVLHGLPFTKVHTNRKRAEYCFESTITHKNPRDFWGSAEKSNPCFFGGFPFLPRKQGNEDQGRVTRCSAFPVVGLTGRLAGNLAGPLPGRADLMDTSLWKALYGNFPQTSNCPEISQEILLNLGCRKWGCNKWGFKGCLAALPRNRPKSAFSALFLPFSPFSGAPEEHLENPENGGKRPFSSDILGFP